MRVLFLLNKLNETDLSSLIERYLGGFQVEVSDIVPEETADYDLIVLWNYKKILKGIGRNRNVMVFHSTDLPKGKGWAPIYNTIIREEKEYCITGILVNDEIDAGEYIVKAKFSMKPNYLAKHLRVWDEELCFLLIGKILNRFPSGGLKGIPETGEGDFYPKRKAEDNRMDVNTSLLQNINHLRACEDGHPAYFIQNGIKYTLKLDVAEEPEFPTDITIQFYDQPQST
ncbi:hypothetical protein [Leptospira kobayashii]|nr:hypothetical protein [Leptospira kobayashii]